MNTIIIFGLILISFISLVGGFKSINKSRTATEFFLMGGKLKLPAFIGTMVASNLSLGNMIFVCSIWGYYFGLSGVFWVAITIILLIVGYNVFGKHFKKYVEDKNNSGSLHDYIASLYIIEGNEKYKTLRYFTSLVTVVTLILAIVLELHIASTLFGTLYNVQIGTTFVILTSLIAVYSCLGGFRTVVDTDILQSVFLVFGICAGIYFYYNFPAEPIKSIEFKTIISGTGWANALGISFLGFGWLLITMDTWQRNCASRSIDTSLNGIILAGSLMVVFVILFAFFGIYIKDVVEPLAIKNNIVTSSGLLPYNDFFKIESLVTQQDLRFCLGFIFIGLIMAAISTADTFLVVLSHSITTDLLISKNAKDLGSLDEKSNIFFGAIGRATIIVVTFIIMISWAILNYFNLLGDPLNLFYVAYSVQYSLLPALLFGIFYKRRNVTSAISSIIAGIIFTLFIGFYFLPKVQQGDMTDYLNLRPDQWLGLLPFLISLISAITYSIANLFKRK